ncbi:hypothetical protein BN938_0712 [Mucinivorans hirudinis]|uniref:Lipoprotein n=1 Tax=Mucinivorans hirudinis TaxID=1433126 RepID=A0A060R6W7_9BACT|nr:hypothetical protein BN938_0712 [Mucinivorans hirudinis]
MKNLIIKLFISTLILTGAFSCGRSDTQDELIVFDYRKSYPEIDLKLSDVADVRIIKMGGVNQGYFVDVRDVTTSDFYVNEKTERIYTKQEKDIYVYDFNGNSVRKMNREGRGPQEYLMLLEFMVDEESNTITVDDAMGKKFVEYDTLFNFKRNIPYKIPTQKNLFRINGDTLLVYSSFKPHHWTEDMPHYFFLISQSTSKLIKQINIAFERPINDDPYYFADLFYPSLIRGKDGVFLTNKCCDTVFFVNNKTLEVAPRFVDATNYNTTECMTIPALETDRYLFLQTHYDLKLSFNVEGSFYVYDKKKRQIFRLKVDNSNPPNHSLSLLNNQCALSAKYQTLSEGFMAVFFRATFLIDNIDKLPPETQKIVKTLKEDDNPLLLLIKIK